MSPSIRTFLLINLLLSVTLITSIAIIGNLFLAHKDIQTQLDAELQRSALQIQAFFSDQVSNRDLKIVQQNLNALLTPQKKSNLEGGEINSGQPEQKLTAQPEFQIFDSKNNMILHSPNAPKLAFTDGTPGLTTSVLNNISWRVNTVYDPKNQIKIMAAERTNYRQELENQLTQDSIFIMMITYPFLGLLIWVIVGRGLDTFKKVAEEVKHRDPTNLKQFNLEFVPSEIEPLIEELNKLFKRLHEAFDREKRFTADAAHELKTPLAALSTQVQVALRVETKEERNQALMKVLSCVNRSTHVIQQLLTLSRMDPEAAIQKPVSFVLAKQAIDVAALLAPEAIAKNIDLELLAPDSTAAIMGNPTAINILIRNLVDNAIRYSPENSFTKIDIQETDQEVILSVIDNGPGIPEEMRERVFERFFRIPGTQTTGSGLGLGIVMQIAKLHQARIKLITPPSGHGLEVQVIFPKNIQS